MMAAADRRTPEQQRRNRRLALALGAVALAFFVGFILVTALRG